MSLDQKMDKTSHVFKNKDISINRNDSTLKIRMSGAGRKEDDEVPAKMTMQKLVELS